MIFQTAVWESFIEKGTPFEEKVGSREREEVV